MNGRGKSVTLPRTGTNLNENQSNGNTGITNRPISYYDNIRENGQGVVQPYDYELQELHFERERSPTQLHLLNTTVPQNIGGTRNLSERHEPTRNSLRHSRMIVMAKSGKAPVNYAPHILMHTKLAKALVGLQILIGVALGTLSLWLLLWAPNLRQRDNPYWSAAPILLSGVFGLVLLSCCKIDYQQVHNRHFIYSLKIVSLFFSIVAGAACLTACIFAIIHLLALSTMTCAPINQLNATCLCTLKAVDNSTSLPVKSYHYIDLSCPEVTSILSILMIFSCGTNAVGAIASLWYVYLHWISRYNMNYSKVRTGECRPKPILLGNS